MLLILLIDQQIFLITSWEKKVEVCLIIQDNCLLCAKSFMLFLTLTWRVSQQSWLFGFFLSFFLSFFPKIPKFLLLYSDIQLIYSSLRAIKLFYPLTQQKIFKDLSDFISICFYTLEFSFRRFVILITTIAFKLYQNSERKLST